VRGRLGLRARLAIALVGIAVLAVGLATLLSNRGLDPLVGEAARSRLQRSAEHMAEVVATVYRDEGGWTPSARATIFHLAELDGLRLTITATSGQRFGPPANSGDDVASAPIRVEGRGVGQVSVSGTGDGLLTPEEEHLQHSLDRLHLIAAAVSVSAALVLAFLLANTLSGPLRRIRLTAQRIERGELDARVELAGDAELRAVGHALNRLAETLDHEEHLRKQSVADLAHELRTPVHGLLSRIEAAQDGVLDDERANLAAMHTEAVRLSRLLEDFSRLTEAERPGFLLAKATVDLAEIADAAAATFAPRFADAGIGFSSSISSALVSGDADRLGQITDNLLSNALRYTEPGGEVRLGVSRDGAVAVLEVSDTGIGIAPGDLQNIYVRFWRGEKSRSRVTGGTGVGLTIVHELVRAHDGRIDVESRPGAGSTFRVSLPALDERGLHENGRSASPDLQTPTRP
jgi:two-component system, OmpR family, sensor histidine kinase BaeS